jgi:hypothetical protein
MKEIVPIKSGQLQGLADGIPNIVVRAGSNAVFAAEEFFQATLNNPTPGALTAAPWRGSSPGASSKASNSARSPGPGRRVRGPAQGLRASPTRHCEPLIAQAVAIFIPDATVTQRMTEETLRSSPSRSPECACPRPRPSL